MFSEVCGHFYVAAGRWSAKRRFAESKDGVAVLKFCISCHIHQPSPVEATTSSQLGSILHLHSKAMPMALWHVSLLSYAHATKGTRTKGQRCPSNEVGHSLRWREPPVSLRERPWSSWSRSSRRPRQDAHHDATRPVRLRPLACEQPHPDNEPQAGKNGQQIRAAAGLNGMLRTRRAGRVAGGRRPQVAEG